MLRALKSFIVFPLLAFTLCAEGQETTYQIPAEEERGFYIGAFVSPDASFRQLFLEEPSSGYEWLLELRERVEIPVVGFTTGVSIGWQFTPHFALASGIQFSRGGWTTRLDDPVYGNLYDPRLGFVYAIDGKIPRRIQNQYRFDYVSLPIALQMELGRKRWRFTARTGISADMLTGAKSIRINHYEEYEPDKVFYDRFSNYKKWNITSSVGAGVHFVMNKRMTLYALPTVRYRLLNIIDYPITAQIFNGGLEVGWLMKL